MLTSIFFVNPNFLVHLLSTAEALAGQVTRENIDNGLIYPPFSKIRKISAAIAANVAAKAYELGEFYLSSVDIDRKTSVILHFHLIFAFVGVATRLPRPENLVKYAESCMYSPLYRSYR